jgi:hypothetical protein
MEVGVDEVGLAVVETLVGVLVQTGTPIGVWMTTVTWPEHGLKVIVESQDPRYGIVVVVVDGVSSRSAIFSAVAAEMRNAPRGARVFGLLSMVMALEKELGFLKD